MRRHNAHLLTPVMKPNCSLAACSSSLAELPEMGLANEAELSCSRQQAAAIAAEFIMLWFISCDRAQLNLFSKA